MDLGTTTLIDRQNDALALQIFSFGVEHGFAHVRRHNYYSIILISQGEAELQIERNQYLVSGKTIVCISPYQPYAIQPLHEVAGTVLNFHPDFYCTYKHQNEIHTEGVLFHNIFTPAFFHLENDAPLLTLLDSMKTEMAHAEDGQHDLLVSYLKIFLIKVVRIKKNAAIPLENVPDQHPQVLQDLVYKIESHFQEKHSAVDYAEMLNVSPAALGKLVKRYFDQTLTQLISNRIMIEAKRELYLTSKSVKEISYLLGYQDEYYFSRFFKKHAGISPKQYRQTVGFAKQEA